MIVKCLNCGLVLKKCLSLACVCPECGISNWSLLSKEEIDRENLEKLKNLLGEAYDMAEGFLKEKGYMYSEKMGAPTMMEATMKERAEKEMYRIDPFHYRKKCKKEGLAFEIIDIKDGNKVRVRKIYLNGHIEGFKGNPLVTNHIFPKMQALKYLAQNINEEYRDLIREFILSDFYPIEIVNNLYKRNKETIEKI